MSSALHSLKVLTELEAVEVSTTYQGVSSSVHSVCAHTIGVGAYYQDSRNQDCGSSSCETCQLINAGQIR